MERLAVKNSAPNSVRATVAHNCGEPVQPSTRSCCDEIGCRHNHVRDEQRALPVRLPSSPSSTIRLFAGLLGRVPSAAAITGYRQQQIALPLVTNGSAPGRSCGLASLFRQAGGVAFPSNREPARATAFSRLSCRLSASPRQVAEVHHCGDREMSTDRRCRFDAR